MADRAPEIKLTNDGLHLEGSILWFDSLRSGELSFLSAPSKSPCIGPKIITTEVTLKILESQQKKPQALVCQYNRPFAVGKLKMELLPSGSQLGGSSLHVDIEGNHDILYAPQLLSQKNSTVRKMQIRKAKTLILYAEHPDPSAVMPNRKKEKERLVNSVKNFTEKGVHPVILCRTMPTAQEVTSLLTEAQIPVSVHSSIFKINRIYEQFGSQLGQYSLHRTKKRRQKALVLPLLNQGRMKLAIPEGPVFCVEDTKNESTPPEAFRQVSDRFYISSTCDGRDLREIIQAVDPSQVYLFGPYTKRYVEALEGLGPTIKPLYPNDQPTLF